MIYFYGIYIIGDVLLSLSANDPDDADLEFGVMGEFYNKLLSIKKIDGKHADVILKQPFDREVFIFGFVGFTYEYLLRFM